MKIHISKMYGRPEENCVFSTGSVLKAGLATLAVGCSWGLCVAAPLLFDSHILECILTWNKWNKHHKNTCPQFYITPATTHITVMVIHFYQRDEVKDK